MRPYFASISLFYPSDESPPRDLFPLPSAPLSYLEVGQIRDDVGPDLVPLDHVATVLGVATHRTRAGTLVESFVDILGGQAEVAIPQDLEGACGLHLVGGMVVALIE